MPCHLSSMVVIKTFSKLKYKFKFCKCVTKLNMMAYFTQVMLRDASLFVVVFFIRIQTSAK